MTYGNAIPKIPSPRPQGWLMQMAERMPRPKPEMAEHIRTLQAIAAANGLSDMTLEEINEEIALTRAGK